VKVQYPICPGRTVEVEGGTLADLFRDLARTVEVFGETHCGLCGGDHIAPIAREAGGFEFFEWRCLDPDCGATLSMGVRKDKDTPGRLFPVRDLDAQGRPDWKTGKPGPHRGWTRYHGPGTEAPPASAAPAAAAAGPKTPRPTAAPTAAAAPARPTPAGPTAGRITANQWEAIQAELRIWGISDAAFLERFGHATPREILAVHFLEALDSAKQPDDELMAIDKRNRGRRAGR
jgi:hypothetical protein